MEVLNRDGVKVNYDNNRIKNAIKKALEASKGSDRKIQVDMDKGVNVEQMASNLTEKVEEELMKVEEKTVEKIQDVVENILMKEQYFSTAKNYIIYRTEHQKMREKFRDNASILNEETFYVIKRNGTREKMSYDKIFKRIRQACQKSPTLNCNMEKISKKVFNVICSDIKTEDLDDLLVNTIKDMIIYGIDYDTLASRIAISKHHKNTALKQSERQLPLEIDTQFAYTAYCSRYNLDDLGRTSPQMEKEFYDYIIENRHEIQKQMDYDRDFVTDYFGFKTLDRGYLLKLKIEKDVKRKSMERIQDMYMRVALGINCTKPNKWKPRIDEPSDYETAEYGYLDDNKIAEEMTIARRDFIPDKEFAFKTYYYLSRGYFIFGTPTEFNCGTKEPNLVSCYLEDVESDSLPGIYNTLHDAAMISKGNGGLGLYISKIRSEGSYIGGSRSQSSGVVPMIRVFDATAEYVNQGGKRKGSFALYLECWHADIEDFVELKLPHGIEKKRARNLFYAFVRNDYFMECVSNDDDWYLMSPDESPNLMDVHNQDFINLYTQYVKEGKYKKKIKARSLYQKVLKSRAECGVPYICEKDSINRKSNQSNLGSINGSNLCCEITLKSCKQETAVCNLASICLPKFVTSDCKDFDHNLLFEISKIVTRNLDRIIDIHKYPTPKTERSNYRHRPIGIGVQGLWDVLVMLGYPFGSDEAIRIDREIAETIYFGSLTASMELAREKGPYSTFRYGEGSPLSKGIFQFDMWEVDKVCSGRWDWDKLRQDIMKYGVRNSEQTAYMPTASTSQILGNIYHNNTECFEPIKSNLYKRKTLSGEFVIFNKHLYNDIIEYGLDIDTVRQQIEMDDGSVQNVESLPAFKKALYKTVWEMDQRLIIDHCFARSPFVSQACSMNIYLKIVDPKILTDLDFYAWSLGLKTQYYTHSRSATRAKQHHRNIAQPSAEDSNKPQTTSSNVDDESDDYGACKFKPGCTSCSA